MVNIELLKKHIDESGMTMVAISEKSGIERGTLYNRLNGVGDFTATEIVGISSALRLKNSERDHIFFQIKV